MDYKPSVTLYNPPSFYYTGVHYDCLPPLNLAIIAAMLKSAGASARVIDLEMQKTYPGQIAPVVHHDHRTTGSAYERFKRKEVVPEFYKRFIGTSKFAQHFYGDVYGHYKIEKGWGL